MKEEECRPRRRANCLSLSFALSPSSSSSSLSLSLTSLTHSLSQPPTLASCTGLQGQGEVDGQARGAEEDAARGEKEECSIRPASVDSSLSLPTFFFASPTFFRTTVAAARIEIERERKPLFRSAGAHLFLSLARQRARSLSCPCR